MEYTGGTEAWPFNGFVGMYNSASWQYARTEAPPEPRGRIEHPSGNSDQHGSVQSVPQGPPFEPLIRSLRKPPPTRDETLQDPRTVFQLLKRYFSRYTVDMVEQVTSCPREIFLNVAETILANSGRERTTAWAYAVGWTQHTYGPQMMGCCALLQLLLGNMGRPGGGIVALRGHASIQGSTDVPTLYHSIHGYMPAVRPQGSRNAEGLHRDRGERHQLLGQLPQVHCLVSQVDVRRLGHPGKRLRLRLAPEDHRGPLPHADVRRDGGRQGQGNAVYRAEPGYLPQCRTGEKGYAAAGVAGGPGHLSHRVSHVLEEVARDRGRGGEAAGHPDRGLLHARRSGCRERWKLYQHSADAAVALQGGGCAGAVPVGPVVHPPARAPAQEDVCEQHAAPGSGHQKFAVGL